MRKKLHITVGDTVKVIAGNEKGKTGTVKEIFRKKDRATVDGVNMIKRHQKPSAANPQGGIVETEAGIHVSNLMVVDSKGDATRIGRRKNSEGKSVRYSKKNQEEIKS
jgi:large subunit ribosomal protein L24